MSFATLAKIRGHSSTAGQHIVATNQARLSAIVA